MNLFLAVFFNPFQNEPRFLRDCSTRLLKTLREKEKLFITSNNVSFSDSVFYPFREIFAIPSQTKFGGYTGISLSVGRSGGRSVRKILSVQLQQLQSSFLDTWQKCSLGAVDVQDTHFVKIPSRITELLPLIWLKNGCPDNSSYSFC